MNVQTAPLCDTCGSLNGSLKDGDKHVCLKCLRMSKSRSMTDTLTRSRVLVAALVAKGVDVAQEWEAMVCPKCGGPYIEESAKDPSLFKCSDCYTWMNPVDGYAVPDLTLPQNLGALLGLAKSLGASYDMDYCVYEGLGALMRCSFKFKYPLWNDRCYGETESLAIIAAMEKAAGITQEDEG